jgi:hypothetical protein
MHANAKQLPTLHGPCASCCGTWSFCINTARAMPNTGTDVFVHASLQTPHTPPHNTAPVKESGQ